MPPVANYFFAHPVRDAVAKVVAARGYWPITYSDSFAPVYRRFFGTIRRFFPLDWGVDRPSPASVRLFVLRRTRHDVELTDVGQ